MEVFVKDANEVSVPIKPMISHIKGYRNILGLITSPKVHQVSLLPLELFIKPARPKHIIPKTDKPV